MTDWVYSPNGRGYRHSGGVVSKNVRHFKKYSVGERKQDNGTKSIVWLIGPDEYWTVMSAELVPLDVEKTGDKFERKICNICHRLLTVDQFAKNQTNQHGILRRPTCIKCRTDIDKRAIKSKQAKDAEKKRPKRGEPFQCPICQKRSIVGITAKIVADHNHHTGNIRGFICDSCNTGLGRFKNGQDCLRDALEYVYERDP